MNKESYSTGSMIGEKQRENGGKNIFYIVSAFLY